MEKTTYFLPKNKMKSLAIYILEDEIITQEVLCNTLRGLGHKICGVNINATKALKEINNLEPDLAFLDIKVVGEKTGIWLGKQLTIPFVYLTAFADDKNIKEAAKTNPLSYLQKPFREKDVFIALELAQNKLLNQKAIFFKDNNFKVKVLVKDIMYAKKEDHYMRLFLKNGNRKLMRATTQDFLNEVHEDFIQIHRSYIINKNFVDAFSSKSIKINEVTLPISNSYTDKVAKLLN